jgi:hypothetical protein
VLQPHVPDAATGQVFPKREKVMKDIRKWLKDREVSSAKHTSTHFNTPQCTATHLNSPQHTSMHLTSTHLNFDLDDVAG